MQTDEGQGDEPGKEQKNGDTNVGGGRAGGKDGEAREVGPGAETGVDDVPASPPRKRRRQGIIGDMTEPELASGFGHAVEPDCKRATEGLESGSASRSDDVIIGSQRTAAAAKGTPAPDVVPDSGSEVRAVADLGRFRGLCSTIVPGSFFWESVVSGDVQKSFGVAHKPCIVLLGPPAPIGKLAARIARVLALFALPRKGLLE